MEQLTVRQREMLHYLAETIRERGYPPSMREIAAHFGIRSTQGVVRHLEALERKGFIERDSVARSIRLAPHLVETDTGRRVALVPLVGEVAAGQPILAVENIEDRLPLCTDWLGVNQEHFILRIRGESMADAIQSGDLVVVERQPTAHRGEIVVALVEDEATVKRYYPEPDRVVLRSDNPAFKDLVVGRDVQILGRVTALIRKY